MLHTLFRERSNLQLLKMNGNTWYPLDFKVNQKKRNLDKLIQKSPVMEFILKLLFAGLQFYQKCTQPSITYSKLIIETIEEGVKYVQSSQ